MLELPYSPSLSTFMVKLHIHILRFMCIPVVSCVLQYSLCSSWLSVVSTGYPQNPLKKDELNARD